MIIIDYSQIAIAGIMAGINNNTAQYDDELGRHIILNIIRHVNVKFKKEFGDIVIACDGKNSWRKQVFPYYKAHRKQTISKDQLIWNQLFDTMDSVKQDLKQYFPYKVVDVLPAEGDDVIATLCQRYGQASDSGYAMFKSNRDPILIISSDKDFAQLHKYGNVQQYDPIKKKMIEIKDPVRALAELILTGDRGDGIPNVLSPGDTYVLGVRSKPLRSTKLEEYISSGVPDQYKANYERNRLLIDLEQVPDEVKQLINETYDSAPLGPKDKLYKYFISRGLTNLLSNVGEFL